MLIHFNDKCNGVVVEREDLNGSTRLWTIDSKCNRDEMLYDFKTEIKDIPNIQCTECGKSWMSTILAGKECYSFTFLAEKNLKIIFTSIILSVAVLFLSCIFLDSQYLKSVVFSVSFFIAFIILVSKQFCEITEVDSCICKIKKKHEERINKQPDKEKGGTSV